MSTKKVIECSGYKVEYEDTPEIRDAVFEKLMESYFKEYGAYSGEVIMQSDDPIIYAPEVLAEIADDIIRFEYIED